MKTLPRPPAYLSKPMCAWWLQTVADYDLEPHHLHLLALACSTWDRCEQARQAIAENGVTFRDDRGNVRARPEVTIERDARLAFARLVRELDLDIDAQTDARSGPPSLRSNRRS
jgi:P27 family predicted phage terminase small subunit